MRQQRHIINEQILEMHLPKTADAFTIQRKLGKLYREQFVPVIDQQLTDRYGNDEKSHYQIDTLTIDLGEVLMEDIVTVFAKELARVLASIEIPESSKGYEHTEEAHSPHETPLKILSHYLMTGILPWWAGDTTKAYLHQQFDALLKTPDTTFRKLLGELRYHSVYLDRFLNTFTGEQLLQSLQLLTTIPLNGLSGTKKKLVEMIRNNPGESSRTLTDLSIAKVFWAAAFDQVHTAENASELEDRSIRQALQVLGADPKAAEKRHNRTSPEAAVGTQLWEIRLMVGTLKIKYPENATWQGFFQQLSQVLNRPSPHRVQIRLLDELKELLTSLKEAHDKSRPLEEARPGIGLKAVTEANLQPLAKHLHVLETIMKQVQPTLPNVIEKLPSGFEDTDFITVQNAGLVLLWPFLQRFFENMELTTGKVFHDEATQHKAVCALQYLADEAEEGLFEGQLILNKVLCGIPLEDTVEPLLLSAGEKAIAEGLLHAVIARGPHWKNMSLNGFRTSYLQREGLLRTRDGHWLLQVKKETYDVTLEKLPWGFAIVKLSWMQEPVMVEWV